MIDIEAALRLADEAERIDAQHFPLQVAVIHRGFLEQAASTVRGLVERVRELEVAARERDRLKAHCQLLAENAHDDIEERPRRHPVGSLIAVAKDALGITIRDRAYDPSEVYWWNKKKAEESTNG